MIRALAGVAGLLLATACTGGGRVDPLPRARYAVRAARLLDPRTGTYSGAVAVLVDQGKIRGVVAAQDFTSSLADSVIQLDSLTLLHGLWDSHVHLTLGGPLRRNLAMDLAAGFTTVMDLGAIGTRVLRLRDSVRAGLIEGPRILAAGLWVGIKGGTCDFNGIGVTGGPPEVRARVRENLAAGADVIKLCISGWAAQAFAVRTSSRWRSRSWSPPWRKPTHATNPWWRTISAGAACRPRYGPALTGWYMRPSWTP